MRGISFAVVIFMWSTAVLAGATSPLNKAHVKNAINTITENVDYSFARKYTPLILGSFKKDVEPNAFSLGPFVTVRKELLKVVNQRQLLAIVAHEIAHAERGHLLKRTGYMVGIPVVHFLKSAWLKIVNPDQYQREKSLWKERGQIDFLIGAQEDANLRMEMQADCFAYQWLNELEKKGFDVTPQDLNEATTAIVGLDYSEVSPEYFEDLPPYQRFMLIQNQYYENQNCQDLN